MADKILKSIINDRTSGAAEIESKVHVYLMNSLRNHRNKSIHEITDAISRIRKRFSSMANILNLLEKLERSLANIGFENARESLALYKKIIEHDRNLTIETAARQICRYKSIFTLSNSSIISRSIFGAIERGWHGEIRIAESRPKKEGTVLAMKCAKDGVKAILGVDTLIPEFVEKSGAVFLGADAVTPGFFVNKIGSEIAVEYADKFKKPVYVAFDRSKMISGIIYKYVPDKNPENEITSRKSGKLEILNPYFEKIIPRGRFNYICGDSIIDPAEIKKMLNRR